DNIRAEAEAAPPPSLTLLRSYSSSYSWLYLRVRNAPTLQILFDLSHDLADLERAAFNFRERHCVDQVFRSDHCAELAQVHLGDDYRFEGRQYLAEIAREWIEVPQVR